ncbi:MAG TPA: hypothetical protein DC058_00140 [Planctomycetaceae bacterium]|nr:hypothetical protein [Planctomycetaceae bacterium]
MVSHAKPRSREGKHTSSVFIWRATDFFLPRMNTDFHGSSQGDVVGKFEPRMDTNGHESMQLGLSSSRSVLLRTGERC